jgi:Cu/Ag efflux protein CusF
MLALLTGLAGLAPGVCAIAQTAAAEAEGVKIDAAGGKLTLKHGEIKSLDMPPMTMVYRVRDPAVLARLQVGDKVRFRAEKAGGQYVATAVEALK